MACLVVTSAGIRSRNVVVVIMLVVVFVAVLALRGGDFAPGSVHAARIVHVQPACAYWMVRVDHFQWRNTRDVPAGWVSPIDGQVRVIDDNTAAFEADGVSVPLQGGDMNTYPPRAFTADCPSTLNR